ncbi:carbon-nitrogen family hydrolase [Paenibacillus sp. NEAU-GSW1]|uniref:carbon-nitrogen family hydrolase n=1 Tax=Paenibacillus sp. NEAU-GSW1 TaxID=2682486 RepID=UPI0012E11175|nr:carbon-nitrogen family hydrolase [Paenibacillus sp. NEAU-GSW1]MUT65425.1 carbon-nitrogen family hydrolase [Paenibacillus sp. NEAU-GSW1]
MTQKLRIALLQMHIEAGNPETNYAKLSSMLEEAVAQPNKPDIIVFPEMWNTGYALTEINELADREGERTKALISDFSRKHNVNIVAGSIAEKKPDGVYNTIHAFDRQGNEIGEYSKIHLFRLMDEEKYLAAGDQPGKLTIEGADAGMMICYDIRFPELSRKLALEGAKLLIVPAEWPHPRLHHWRTLLTARAIENQMYVIACNRVGTSGTTEFFGHSMVLDPWGETIVEGGDEEAILYAEIDLSVVDTVRAKIPVFEDRRPTLY